ncbi:hypothetical protein CANCADRAFT_16578, partial [Tortispora caseinolytica NRRL Y-17796]
LYQAHGKVKIGQVHRYQIFYTPSRDAVANIKSLHLRVRNEENIALRGLYFSGPFLLYAHVYPEQFNPFRKSPPNLCPSFNPTIRPAQSFHTDLPVPSKDGTHVWIVDIVSQLIFSRGSEVAFSLTIGHTKEDTANLLPQDGSASPALQAVHKDTLDLWNLPVVVPSKPLHLVVLSHGLYSNTSADMLFLKEFIDSAVAKTGEAVAVRGYFDNAGLTERGVKYLGRRLAKHIHDKLMTPDVTKISFIGHSLGGLVMTYAIAYLNVHYPSVFKQAEPINFITLASPLLGLTGENPMYVKLGLDIGVLGRTGQDLGLTWRPSLTAKHPVLKVLPTGPAAEILRRFHRRTVYANVVNDGIVPLRTSSLLFLDYRALRRAHKIKQEESKRRASVEVTKASPNASKDENPIVSFFQPLGSLFSSLIRPQGGGSKIPSAILSAQTVGAEGGEDDGGALPPKANVLVSATAVLNPPLPDNKFIMDPSSRRETIFHDRVYFPEDIPPPKLKRTHSDDPTDDSHLRARTEEKIARKWHTGMAWRKVLVHLEPDAHNNMIVRRMFANAYGWPVLEHLVQEHFA